MTYDLRLYADSGLRSTRNISCLRRYDLVYARTLKCASEFFWHNLQDAGWQELRWEEIDWQNNHVFSFIMDPIKRRHKGIAEWVIHNHCQHELMHDSRFQLLLNAAPSLDEHSASLQDLYGARMDDIEWLPATDDHSVAIGCADKLLERMGHEPIKWIKQATRLDGSYVDYEHSSVGYMEDLYQKIKQIWDQNPVGDSNHYYFEKDLLTWRRVCLRHNILWKTETAA